LPAKNAAFCAILFSSYIADNKKEVTLSIKKQQFTIENMVVKNVTYNTHTGLVAHLNPSCIS